MRISTVFVLGGALAVLGFSANVASAGNLTVHATPSLKFQAPKTGGTAGGHAFSSNSGRDTPTESVTLNFTKISHQYTRQNQ
jgi:hypothetical protein